MIKYSIFFICFLGIVLASDAFCPEGTVLDKPSCSCIQANTVSSMISGVTGTVTFGFTKWDVKNITIETNETIHQGKITVTLLQKVNNSCDLENATHYEIETQNLNILKARITLADQSKKIYKYSGSWVEFKESMSLEGTYAIGNTRVSSGGGGGSMACNQGEYNTSTGKCAFQPKNMTCNITCPNGSALDTDDCACYVFYVACATDEQLFFFLDKPPECRGISIIKGISNQALISIVVALAVVGGAAYFFVTKTKKFPIKGRK